MPEDPLFIDDRVTPLTPDEFVRALFQGYQDVFRTQPTARALACFVAQVCLETGNGKATHCFNFGNVKRVAGEPWTMFRCNEVIKGRVKRFDPPHAQTHFRAFRCAADGAAEYLSFLLRDRYRNALAQAQAGDPAAFVDALHMAGYFTANVDKYRAAVVSIFARVLPACERAVSEGQLFTRYECDEILGLVGKSLAEASHQFTARASEDHGSPE